MYTSMVALVISRVYLVTADWEVKVKIMPTLYPPASAVCDLSSIASGSSKNHAY